MWLWSDILKYALFNYWDMYTGIYACKYVCVFISCLQYPEWNSVPLLSWYLYIQLFLMPFVCSVVFFFSFFISQCFQIICPKIFELLHYISLQYITSFVHVCKISEFAVHLALRRNQSSNHTERWMFYCKWCKVSVLLDTIYKQPPNNRIEF